MSKEKFMNKYGEMMLTTIFSAVIGCTVASPFQQSSKLGSTSIQPETIVVVALTEVETKGSIFEQITFWKRVSSVRSSLEDNQGYLGGSIRRQLFGNRAWTMTVWENEDSLENFVDSREHERAMKEGAPAVEANRFYRIRKPWKDVPIKWEEVETLIKENGRN